MRCYACERQDTSPCPRCSKDYCPDHGADLCAACLDPIVAAPSSATFRIALFALLGASVLALWLLVRSPGLPGDNGGVVQQPDITPDFTPGLTPDTGETLTPTASPDGSPVLTPTPIPDNQTPAPTPVPTATPTPAPIEHIVETGDTWNALAAQYGVDPQTLASTNGYSLADVLPLGITLIIPQ
ncbi:MAG: LysM peptidoglycan-binding domain-containing protein [Chloroflexi bacterium]|nr:LysM peptidoglycan-binding domain-containing protein [Chloroflexota bacterium]